MTEAAKEAVWIYRLLIEMVQQGRIDIEYIQTDFMVADGLTKPLGPQKFKTFLQQMGM